MSLLLIHSMHAAIEGRIAFSSAVVSVEQKTPADLKEELLAVAAVPGSHVLSEAVRTACEQLGEREREQASHRCSARQQA